jgi:hypothetical protein
MSNSSSLSAAASPRSDSTRRSAATPGRPRRAIASRRAVRPTVISGLAGAVSAMPRRLAALRCEATPPVSRSPAASATSSVGAPATRYTPGCMPISRPVVSPWSICRSVRPHATSWARVMSRRCASTSCLMWRRDGSMLPIQAADTDSDRSGCIHLHVVWVDAPKTHPRQRERRP